MSRTMTMAFWVLYDHLGLFVAVNLVWALVVSAIVSLAGACILRLPAGVQTAALAVALLSILGVITPLFVGGLAHVAAEIIERREVTLTSVMVGMRRFGARALALGMGLTIAFGASATGVVFYPLWLGDTMPMVTYSLAGATLWMGALVGCTGLYAFPALVQRKAGVFATVRLSALLALANPAFTVCLAALVALVCAVGAMPLLGFTVALSAVAVVVSCAYEMLAREYALRLGAAERTPGYPPRDEDDDYLNRTLRDALFPWKS